MVTEQMIETALHDTDDLEVGNGVDESLVASRVSLPARWPHGLEQR